MGAVWWVPLSFFVLVVAGMWLLLARTIVGRHIYAMGGNEEAARLSGIRTERLKWLAYVLGAMTASLAGVLYCAEVTTADPEKVGRAYELNAIAAAVVGGCSLMGGIGTIPGVILGALFLRVVIDAVPKVIKQGAADDWQGLVIGVLVVLAVAFNELRRGTGTAKAFFPGALGAWTIAILGVFFGSLVGVSSNVTAGLVTGGITVVLLGAVKLYEARRAGT
jgi:ribose/xylose/arabinose/galactoside ABC-type transport system permease subunit